MENRGKPDTDSTYLYILNSVFLSSTTSCLKHFFFLISFSLSLSFPFNPSLCYRLVVTRYINKKQFFAVLDNYWTYLLPVS